MPQTDLPWPPTSQNEYDAIVRYGFGAVGHGKRSRDRSEHHGVAHPLLVRHLNEFAAGVADAVSVVADDYEDGPCVF